MPSQGRVASLATLLVRPHSRAGALCQNPGPCFICYHHLRAGDHGDGLPRPFATLANRAGVSVGVSPALVCALGPSPLGPARAAAFTPESRARFNRLLMARVEASRERQRVCEELADVLKRLKEQLES
jgi:hypothetical protein